MTPETRFTARVAATVALGGFLMGFDASVISGVVGFIETEFALTKVELGWSVASLTLTATLAMMIAGPLSDRLGRRPVLQLAALLFLISAIASALAPTFAALVIARMVGGLGVGAALIIAPMYIAEISPAEIRGRMVSFNQLNIVIGLSAAFFTNYLILNLGNSEASWVHSLGLERWSWRWMLGLEALPALIYLGCLPLVPESPRWLMMRGRSDRAMQILSRAIGSARAEAVLAELTVDSEGRGKSRMKPGGEQGLVRRFSQLFSPSLRKVLTIGVVVAVLQQITGINSVFFYAPMIFEQSGIGTDAAFLQAVAVGLINLVFTIIAMFLIDRLGRRLLLAVGVSGIAGCMFLLAFAFNSATYQLTAEDVSGLPSTVNQQALADSVGVMYQNDLLFRDAMVLAIGESAFQAHESDLVAAAIDMSASLVLVGILGFVASFAISLGPVMWVLFSELFPNAVRGLAISFVGLINSGVSFGVQLVFPWELANLGNAGTFLIYGIVAVIGLFLILRLLPETKGRSLEQIEQMMVTSRVSQ